VNLSVSNVVRINPVVTVAMSVLNGGDQVQMAVRSIMEQTFVDWELLIVDDGSTDGAIEKLPFLNDSRVVVIRDGLNKGLSARLNQAIDIARGQYFARMDHDDVSHPERLARQVAFLDSNPETDLLATGCVTIGEAYEVNGCLPFAQTHMQICARPWLGFSMPHPTWMGRINWFKKYRYKDPAPYCCEDNEILLRAHVLSRYYALPEQLLAYRIREKTPWKKLWATRRAMWSVQREYFIMSHQWALVALSGIAMAMRVAKDICEQFDACVWRQRRVQPTESALKDWTLMLKKIKEEKRSAL
jgi:glycosyltransferase involved in cell wall biosynthesis